MRSESLVSLVQCWFLLVYLELFVGRLSAYKLEQCAHWTSGHSFAICVRLITTAAHHSGHIHMDPRLVFRYEFTQKSSCSAGSASTAFSNVVQVVTFVVGHLFGVEFEEWHSPHSITTLRSGSVQMFPEATVVGEGTGNAGTQSILMECQVIS